MLGFSSIGSVEGINAIMTGQLIKLSEQQLIDCINITHGAFEEGGLPANAFWYIKQNRGVVPAESYPYVARKCPCKIFEDYMVTIDGYQFVPQDENSLEKAGIADCHHETPYSELDHSMLAVAYDSFTGLKDHQEMVLNLQGAYADSDILILPAPSTPAGKTSTTGVGVTECAAAGEAHPHLYRHGDRGILSPTSL
nr:KDEL-tailed cysteine endopeptidase CEP2-like [Aegilops tauschii subsp. strangulata]